MTPGRYEPELAERSVHELAAVSDAELTAGVQAATVAFLQRVDELRATGWPSSDWDRHALAVAERARDTLAKLPTDPPLQAMVDVVLPVLAAWWSDHPAAVRPVHNAVERLREAAIGRPSLARECRQVLRNHPPL